MSWSRSLSFSRGPILARLASNFSGKTALITGAASGFGLEFARRAAREKMNLCLVDVQESALEKVAVELKEHGVPVLTHPCDVSNSSQMGGLVTSVLSTFGVPHLLFNNAGVACGGLVWENSEEDWDWVLGVNVRGVVNGVRLFTPLMLAAAQQNPTYRGHIINTASMAGLLTPPILGIYNVSKHAVVALSESLYHDLQLVTTQVSTSVLCPYYVQTAITKSHKHRPTQEQTRKPTASQAAAQAITSRAVANGKITATQISDLVFDAIVSNQFYILSHPAAMEAVRTRMEALLGGHNPPNPFAARPDLGQELRKALGS